MKNNTEEPTAPTGGKLIKRRVFLAGLGVGSVALMAANPTESFGSLPSGSRLERIKKSPQYRNGSFKNQTNTPQLVEGASFISISKDFFFKKVHGKEPKQALPFAVDTLFNEAITKPRITWLGHSSYVLEFENFTLVVDPVFHRASPVSWAGPKQFQGPDSFGAANLPGKIDAVLITHDHYDHLDFHTVQDLKHRVPHWFTSLGVGSHLEYWGVPADRITELDWFEEAQPAQGYKLTALPARHFSGRGFTRDQTLWSSFALKTPKLNLYLGGDSGYEKHFAEIGKAYGPFDLALLECGQYGVNWPYIHMSPEQAALASIELGAKIVMPVHWGKFALAMHPWQEPVERFLAKAESLKVEYQVATPFMGKTTSLANLNGGMPFWWRGLE